MNEKHKDGLLRLFGGIAWTVAAVAGLITFFRILFAAK